MLQKTHIRTKSGQDIWYEDPSKIMIIENDIFEGLRNLCRYSGQLKITILQHLALCVKLAEMNKYNALFIAYVAAHDLHEAYINDIPRGLKECLPDYQRIETLWEKYIHDHIGLKYPLDDDIQRKVKFIDLRALCIETHHGGWYETNLKTWDPIIWVAHDTGGMPSMEEIHLMDAIFHLDDQTLWDIVRKSIIYR